MKETWGVEIDFSNTWAVKKILHEEQDGGHTVVLTAASIYGISVNARLKKNRWGQTVLT